MILMAVPTLSKILQKPFYEHKWVILGERRREGTGHLG
jgi:hypothetical protein